MKLIVKRSAKRDDYDRWLVSFLTDDNRMSFYEFIANHGVLGSTWLRQIEQTVIRLRKDQELRERQLDRGI